MKSIKIANLIFASTLMMACGDSKKNSTNDNQNLQDISGIWKITDVICSDGKSSVFYKNYLNTSDYKYVIKIEGEKFESFALPKSDTAANMPLEGVPALSEGTVDNLNKTIKIFFYDQDERKEESYTYKMSSKDMLTLYSDYPEKHVCPDEKPSKSIYIRID